MFLTLPFQHLSWVNYWIGHSIAYFTSSRYLVKKTNPNWSFPFIRKRKNTLGSMCWSKDFHSYVYVDYSNKNNNNNGHIPYQIVKIRSKYEGREEKKTVFSLFFSSYIFVVFFFLLSFHINKEWFSRNIVIIRKQNCLFRLILFFFLFSLLHSYGCRHRRLDKYLILMYYRKKQRERKRNS